MAAGTFVNTPPPRGPKLGLGYLLQPGQVLLQAWNDVSLRVKMELGDGPWVPQFTPGWEVIERTRRVGLTEWTGRDPVRIAGPVMLDGLERNDGARVERDIRILEKLGGHRIGNTPPPKIFIDADGAVPHDRTRAPHLQWVIEQIDWGDALRDRRGRRVRQFADLVLLQYVEEAAIAGLPAIKKKQSERRGTGWVDVRQGDTLQRIAARYGLTKAEVREAKRINKIRDVTAVIKKARIKLPPRAGVFGGG